MIDQVFHQIFLPSVKKTTKSIDLQNKASMEKDYLDNIFTRPTPTPKKRVVSQAQRYPKKPQMPSSLMTYDAAM